MWSPVKRSPGRPEASRTIARASPIATPNLCRLRPVEMWGWLSAAMSGLTRRATRAVVPRRRAAHELARRFGVDRLDPQPDRPVDLRRGLPHAREDDVPGGEAGPQGHLYLAAGVGVHEAAGGPDDLDHREVGVGLERVVHGVRPRPEGGPETTHALADDGRAVDVDRRADLRRHRGQRHAVAFPSPAAANETRHRRRIVRHGGAAAAPAPRARRYRRTRPDPHTDAH